MNNIIEILKEQKDDLEDYNTSKFTEGMLRVLSDAIYLLEDCIVELEKL